MILLDRLMSRCFAWLYGCNSSGLSEPLIESDRVMIHHVQLAIHIFLLHKLIISKDCQRRNLIAYFAASTAQNSEHRSHHSL